MDTPEMAKFTASAKLQRQLTQLTAFGKVRCSIFVGFLLVLSFYFCCCRIFHEEGSHEGLHGELSNSKLFESSDDKESDSLYPFTKFDDMWGSSVKDFFASMKPSFDCSSHITKVGVGDGGKWTCGLKTLARLSKEGNPCVVYSIGVGWDSSFEAEILRETNCNVYAYDPTVNGIGPQVRNMVSLASLPPSNRVKFHKVGISSLNWSKNGTEMQTLKSMMSKYGHTWIDILKIDAEGAEIYALETILSDFDQLPFGQLLVEVHIQNVEPPEEQVKRRWVVSLFKRMEQRGMRIFKQEANQYWPNGCSEYSLVNTNTLKLFMDKDN